MRNLSIAAFTCAAFLQSAPVDKPVVWSAADIRWTDNPAMKGAQQAILWGDPTKGAYGALKRIPAGTVVAMHALQPRRRPGNRPRTAVVRLDPGRRQAQRHVQGCL